MNVAGTTVEVSIHDTIALGQSVFDSTNTKVGTVCAIDSATGCFTVSPNTLSRHQMHIPYRLIRYIDPHELFVGASKEELTRDYSAR